MVLMPSPFDVPELNWMWHFASKQWYIGPPTLGWAHGWYYSRLDQMYVLWPVDAQATVRAEPGGPGMPPTQPPQAAGVRPASETAGSAAQPAEGRRPWMASPFDVQEFEWMWHLDSQQWIMGPPKPGWPNGWYYNWPRQMHELWQGSSGPALTHVPPTPLADAFLAAAGGLEERLQEPRAGTGSGAQAASASPAQAGTGSGAQPASASPAQAESDTAALHEIIGLLWQGHVPQRVLRAGGTVHVVAEEVGGRERMERLLEIAINRRRPGVDAHQEKRWRAGKDPLPEQRVVLDEKEVELCMNDWKEDFLANELNDQEGLRRRQAAVRQNIPRAGQNLHQFCRTRFQAHLFHISGNIHVLRCMLAQPCTSTGDLLGLARAWDRIVHTKAYQRSVADSTQKTADQAILKAEAHKARRRFSAAMHILQQLRRRRLREEDLDAVQRELVEAEASGELRRCLDEANDLYGFSGVEDRHVGTSRLMLRNIFGAG